MLIQKSLILFSLFTIGFGFSQDQSITHHPDTLIIGYSINPPFLYHNEDKLEGLSYWIWQELIRNETTNFKYKELPLDSLLQGLKTGSVDLVISPLTITSDRSQYIYFSVPYYIGNSTFMINKTSNKDRFLSIFSSIFSWGFMKILVFLLLLLLIFGFLVWVFERKKNPEEFGEDSRGIWHGLWWSAVTMTTVGYGDKSPKTVGGRIIGLIWMFAGIILISSITASITSSLTVHKLNYSTDDIHSFRKKNIGTVKDSATERWLSNHFFINITTYETYELLIEGFRNEEIDMVAYDEPLLKYTIQNEPEKKWELLNIRFNESMYGFGGSKFLPGNSRDKINDQILRLKESDRWNQLLMDYDLEK